MALAAGVGGYEDLLLVVPRGPGAPQLDLRGVERFCEDEFPLSYELPRAVKITGPRGEGEAILVGTNSAYPRVLGLSLVAGSFFSREAWEGELRLGTLNETAARELVGSDAIAGTRFRLRGETWMILGVIRDGDEENRRIYVPSSVEGGWAFSLAARLDHPRRIGAAYARDRLKTLGVREGAFEFYPLGDQVLLLQDRALAAGGFLALFLLLSLLPLLSRRAAAFAGELRGELRRRYPGELLRRRWRELLPRVTVFPALPATLGAALFLALKLLALVLPWGDLPSLADLGKDQFAAKLAALRFWELPSGLLFGVSLVLSTLFLVLALLSPRDGKRGSLPSPQ
jgi:hypothetical protein